MAALLRAAAERTVDAAEHGHAIGTADAILGELDAVDVETTLLGRADDYGHLDRVGHVQRPVRAEGRLRRRVGARLLLGLEEHRDVVALVQERQGLRVRPSSWGTAMASVVSVSAAAMGRGRR